MDTKSRMKFTAVTIFAVLFSISWLKAQMAGEQDKVVICHVPPGNPGKAHTITVSSNAVAAHLAHGDRLGDCSAEPPTCIEQCTAAFNTCLAGAGGDLDAEAACFAEYGQCLAACE